MNRQSSMDTEALATAGGFDHGNHARSAERRRWRQEMALGGNCIECGWSWYVGQDGGRIHPGGDTGRPGVAALPRAFSATMGGVLDEADEKHREVIPKRQTTG